MDIKIADVGVLSPSFDVVEVFGEKESTTLAEVLEHPFMLVDEKHWMFIMFSSMDMMDDYSEQIKNSQWDTLRKLEARLLGVLNILIQQKQHGVVKDCRDAYYAMKQAAQEVLLNCMKAVVND